MNGTWQSMVAVVVGLLWGALSIVFFTDPDYITPVTLVDYLAVILFSAALAALAPAAWLFVKAAGEARIAHRRAAIATGAAGTIFGVLTLADGGLLVALGVWLVVGVVLTLGPSTAIRAAAAIIAVSGPVGGFGNFIEDGLGIRDPGSGIYLLGAGGSAVGLLGLTIALALGRRPALAALAAATTGGVFTSIQLGGGLVVLVAWLLFALWLWRGHPTQDVRNPPNP